MATLPDPVKLFVVQALACYDTPTQVAQAVKAEFGITVTRQQIGRYDASKAGNRDVSAKLRAVFEGTRAKFLEDLSSIPLVHQSYRLRSLQRSLEQAEARGNTAMVMHLLEQAAKEVGGMYSNRRELTGAGGGPIAAVGLPSVIELVSPAELQQAVLSVQEKF